MTTRIPPQPPQTGSGLWKSIKGIIIGIVFTEILENMDRISEWTNLLIQYLDFHIKEALSIDMAYMFMSLFI